MHKAIYAVGFRRGKRRASKSDLVFTDWLKMWLDISRPITKGFIYSNNKSIRELPCCLTTNLKSFLPFLLQTKGYILED